MLRCTTSGRDAQAWTMLMCPFEGSLQLLAGSNEEIQGGKSASLACRLVVAAANSASFAR
jgi:hypothetical protein